MSDYYARRLAEQQARMMRSAKQRHSLTGRLAEFLRRVAGRLEQSGRD